MDNWKPLDPVLRHQQVINGQTPPATTVPRALKAYAAPAHSTRHAPPAHPHPPSSAHKRRSFLPSWAGGGSGTSSQYISVAGSAPVKTTARSQDVSGRGDSEGGVEDDRIGPFPPTVHTHIIEHLPLGDLVRYMASCRSAAILIAREEVWRARVERTRWRSLNGVAVKTLHGQPQPKPSSSADWPKNTPDGEANDEKWKDYAGQNGTSAIADDSFGPLDWSSSTGPQSGSVANCTASLQQTWPSSRPVVAKSLFSCRAESCIPSCASLPSYEVVKSYRAALLPFCKSLEASGDSPENSLLFTGPDSFETSWDAVERSTLLGNLIRAALPFPEGSSILTADLSSSGSDADRHHVLEDCVETSNSLTASLIRSASLQTTQLFAAFTASADRREDALKASAYGASGTEAAVSRAEGDMRIFAVGIWELGSYESRLAAHASLLRSQRGSTDGEAEEVHASRNKGAQAKNYWLHARTIDMEPTLTQRDAVRRTHYKDNFVLPTSGRNFAPILNFTPMDTVMTHIIAQFRAEGELVARLFPPEQGVLLAWADMVLRELITQYIEPLLEFAMSHSVHLYLRCCAATLTQSLRLVEALCNVAPPKSLPKPTVLSSRPSADEELKAESVDWNRRFAKFYHVDACSAFVYKRWDLIIQTYLEHEQDWVQTQMQAVADQWDEDLVTQSAASRVDATFLTAQNPAAVKRSVLTGFKDVLLLPVTVVPRTAVHVGGAVFRTAGKKVSQLNSLKWQGASASMPSATGPGKDNGTGFLFPPTLGRGQDDASKVNVAQGYIDFSSADGLDGGPDVYDDEGDEGTDIEDSVRSKVPGPGIEDDWSEEVRAWKEVAQKASQTSHEQKSHSASSVTKLPSARPGGGAAKLNSSTPISYPASTALGASKADASTSARRKGSLGGAAVLSRSGTPVAVPSEKPMSTPTSLQRMQLLLSLDVALQMIHLDRDSLKRVETFSACPGQTGAKVRNAIEEIAVCFLRCLVERHVTPGFEKAIKQVQGWYPSAHAKKQRDCSKGDRDANEKAGSSRVRNGEEEHVEPLVHFFELVHVGDTISQMVQVYFDQELSRHIDRTDFLNAVVREKKRFESSLDEAVATGLNAGVDLLMSEAEHIITTHQDPRDFYPETGKDMDLGNPTEACSEAIDCLETHCRLLVGCADKSILEVFWQEIGLRLHSILCKHLKRQIISLDGGFKVIADLNAYHGFVSTLKQPSLMVYFDGLKMLGNVFIIDNPRELAQLVRDASLFRGTLTPDDVYEFLQARCDFKAIERAVDKEMFGFKMSEDCVVM